nr:hypothetical protein Iba_chr04eCG19380 [Ipomoea batatas]
MDVFLRQSWLSWLDNWCPSTTGRETSKIGGATDGNKLGHWEIRLISGDDCVELSSINCRQIEEDNINLLRINFEVDLLRSPVGGGGILTGGAEIRAKILRRTRSAAKLLGGANCLVAQFNSAAAK